MNNFAYAIFLVQLDRLDGTFYPMYFMRASLASRWSPRGPTVEDAKSHRRFGLRRDGLLPHAAEAPPSKKSWLCIHRFWHLISVYFEPECTGSHTLHFHTVFDFRFLSKKSAVRFLDSRKDTSVSRCDYRVYFPQQSQYKDSRCATGPFATQLQKCNLADRCRQCRQRRHPASMYQVLRYQSKI